MKVNILHDTFTKGIFSKTTYYRVTLKVELSNEEEEIIKSNNLWTTVLLTREPPASGAYQGNNDLEMAELFWDESRTDFLNIYEAKQFDSQLREVLARTKEFLNANSETADSSNFEL